MKEIVIVLLSAPLGAAIGVCITWFLICVKILPVGGSYDGIGDVILYTMLSVHGGGLLAVVLSVLYLHYHRKRNKP